MSTDSRIELAGSVREQLFTLRMMLVKARHELIEAEAALADEQGAVHSFRVQFRQRLGELMEAVQTIQNEMKEYLSKLQRLRMARAMGISMEEVEAYWQFDGEVGEAEAEPLPELNEDEAVEIKRLYRELARRFHPDFAANPADRHYRTQMMAAVNNAYGARDVGELRELLDEPYTPAEAEKIQSEAQAVQRLRAELARCHRRMREIQREMETLQEQHLARLSRDAQLAEAQGRDLLGEIAAELKRKLAQMETERDFLKIQCEDMGENLEVEQTG